MKRFLSLVFGVVLSFAMSAEGGKASVDKFSLYSFVRNPKKIINTNHNAI